MTSDRNYTDEEKASRRITMLVRLLEDAERAANLVVDEVRTRNVVLEQLAAGANDEESTLRIFRAASERLGIRWLEERLEATELESLLAERGSLYVRVAASRGESWHTIHRRGASAFVVRSLSGEDETTREGHPGVVVATLRSFTDEGDASQTFSVWIPTPLAPLASIVSPQHEKSHGDSHGHHISPFIRLWELIRLERSDILIVLVFAAASGVLSLIVPISVQSLVNFVAFGALLQPLVVLTVLVVGVLICVAVLRTLQVAVVERLQQRLFARVALDLAYRLPRVEKKAFDVHYGPEIVNRFFDVLTIQKSATLFLVDGINVVFQLTIGMLVLSFYHPLLLAFDAVLTVLVFVVVFVFGTRGPTTAISESRSKYAVAAWLQEISLHRALFKSSFGARLALGQADALTRRYISDREKHFAVLVRQIIGTYGLHVFANGTLLGLGGWLVIERQLTLGQLVAAELIVALVALNLAKLGKLLEGFYDLIAAVDKVGHLVDLPLEPSSSGEVIPTGRAASISFKDVHVELVDDAGREDIAVPNVTIAAGERVAIVGSGGVGKSRIAEAIHGLRPIHSGVLKIGGVDARNVSLMEMRARTALITPEIETFSGTLSENLFLGRPDLSFEDVRAALRLAELDRRVETLPSGLDTKLSVTGAPLSRTDALRVSIARAVLAKPAILIVDGAFSGFDSVAREKLVRNLSDPKAAWTFVYFTKPTDPLLKMFDRVIDLGAPAYLEGA